MTRPTLRLTTLCCAAAVLTLALAGCTGISVQRVKAPDLLDAWRASILDADELSPRSQQTLRQLDLDRLYLREPSLAYSRLQALAVRDAQPDYLFASAARPNAGRIPTRSPSITSARHTPTITCSVMTH